jgi:CRISPR-associated protein Csm3
LLKHFQVTGIVTNRTNLRVGGSDPGIDIGGIDNPVIRDPVSRVPYIPGSSIKGKLRSILEYRYGKVQQVDRGARPCGCGTEGCPVCTLFGPHFNAQHRLGPSRLLLRDAFMLPESVERLGRVAGEGSLYTAVKTETMIDRSTGMAARGSLRNQEVVPAGSKFALAMSVRVFEGDDQDQLAGWIREALDTLPNESLGGSGSRGYGWVEVEYNIEGL